MRARASRLPLLLSPSLGVLALLAPQLAAADAPPADARAEEEDEAEPSDDADDGEGDVGTDKRGKKGKKVGASGKRAGAGAAAGASGMKGRFGLGATRTLSGLNAITGRYYLVDKFSMGLHAGFATYSHREANDQDGAFTEMRTVGYFGGGLEALFWPVQGDRSQQVHADFGLGGRLVVYKGFTGADEDTDKINDPLEIAIDVPLTAQVFIGRRVAIAPEFGVVFRIVPGSREPDPNNESDANPGTGAGARLGTTNGPGFGVEFGDHAGLFIGLSVLYHFGRL